jgi:glutamate-5-semialdehyde dehydrogenase
MNTNTQDIQNIKKTAIELAKKARNASANLLKLHPQLKNEMLLNLANDIEKQQNEILEQNKLDVENAINKGMDKAFVDRLTLNPLRIKSMAEGVRQIASLPNVVGEISDVKIRPNGMQIGKMRSPIGVIAIIYEARPNVTIDAAALCFKSGNTCILRGGSEAINTNKFLAQILAKNILIENAVQIVATADRQMITELVQLKNDIDVVIPRGGKGLIERLMQESKIPMLKHLDGICHTYIDEYADVEMAVKVSFNAKCQRYGTCNTTETLLVHKNIVNQILPSLANLYATETVELRCDEQSYDILNKHNYAYLKQVEQNDWTTEYLAPILSIKVVEDIEQAIEHINTYSSKHTDAIITNNHVNAMDFLKRVDSASVMVNASTRLADGFEYGLGAEIGISNDKLHVRGPVGLEGLTNQKYIVLGHGEIRE